MEGGREGGKERWEEGRKERREREREGGREGGREGFISELMFTYVGSAVAMAALAAAAIFCTSVNSTRMICVVHIEV